MNDTLTKVLRMIEAAESSLKSAHELLETLSPGLSTKSGSHFVKVEEAKSYEQGESQIIEGTFDGQNMIGPNGKVFPVAANYASKSKLVEGDRLKLTIMPNGTFMFKQIAPVDRDFVKGTIVKEDGQYRVIANGKSYKVLLASVTYYKGDVGDEVTLIIPKSHEGIWGTIEALIPQVGASPVNQNEVF